MTFCSLNVTLAAKLFQTKQRANDDEILSFLCHNDVMYMLRRDSAKGIVQFVSFSPVPRREGITKSRLVSPPPYNVSKNLKFFSPGISIAQNHYRWYGNCKCSLHNKTK